MAGWYSSRGGWWLYLVRLEDRAHEGLVGAWFLEAGFGPCAATTPPRCSKTSTRRRIGSESSLKRR